MDIVAKNNETLKIDLHCHSDRFGLVDEYVPDTPQALAEYVADEASELGGFAHTNHDTLDGTEEALERAEELGVIAVPGVEITTGPIAHKKGLRFAHAIVLMQQKDALWYERHPGKFLPNVPFMRSFEYVADWAHDMGAALVVPHPTPKGNVVSLSYPQIEELILRDPNKLRVAGVETRTRFQSGKNQKEVEKYLRQIDLIDALVKRHGLASVGSSDSHNAKLQLGVAATEISRLRIGYNSDDVVRKLLDVETRRKDIRAIKLREAPRGGAENEGPAKAHVRRFIEKGLPLALPIHSNSKKKANAKKKKDLTSV